MHVPRRRRESGFELQMTAMIDVVFLLLIFFLWTSSFVVPEFDLPSSLSLPPQGNRSSTPLRREVPFDEIVIRLIDTPTEEPRVVLNQESMPDLNRLSQRLQAIAALGAQPSVIVHPDSAVPMESAIKVYDVARQAGLDRVLFAVNP